MGTATTRPLGGRCGRCSSAIFMTLIDWTAVSVANPSIMAAATRRLRRWLSGSPALNCWALRLPLIVRRAASVTGFGAEGIVICSDWPSSPRALVVVCGLSGSIGGATGGTGSTSSADDLIWNRDWLGGLPPDLRGGYQVWMGRGSM